MTKQGTERERGADRNERLFPNEVSLLCCLDCHVFRKGVFVYERTNNGAEGRGSAEIQKIISDLFSHTRSTEKE